MAEVLVDRHVGPSVDDGYAVVPQPTLYVDDVAKGMESKLTGHSITERTMALDPATVAALRAWRKTQLEERMTAGPGWAAASADWHGVSRSDLVFTWPDGRMVNPDRISAWFHQHRKASGLPHVRLHDVRHAYASAALSSTTGWHEVKIISERLGHASVGITLDRYSHVLPQADQQTADTLARVILGTRDERSCPNRVHRRPFAGR